MKNSLNYPDVIIDEQFKLMLPVLDDVTLAGLEASILEHGCQIPLVLWNGILIDGYNRYSILSKHNLPFETINMEFPSRDEVLIWIIENQITRRNLTQMQLSVFRGMHYNAVKRIQGSNNQFSNQSEKYHSDTFQKEQPTAVKLAADYNVSRITIMRDSQVANAVTAIGEISPDIKRDILSEKTKISRKRLRELAIGSHDDIAEAVEQIKAGTFENRSSGASINNGSENNGTVSDTIDSKDIEELKEWEISFGKMTDDFRKVLRNYAKKDDTPAIRSAIRQYINMLEELYKNI